jgi:hypothetical protein
MLGRRDLRRRLSLPDRMPVAAPARPARSAPNLLLQMLLRSAPTASATPTTPTMWCAISPCRRRRPASTCSASSTRLNWVENMRVAMDAVLESGKMCEAAICYTGDIDDPDRAKYSLDYYVKMAKELEAAGAHVIGVKDMAGPAEAACGETAGLGAQERSRLPIHFHTHDTSGIAAASVLAAEAGRRRRRRRDGRLLRPHLPALPRLDRRGAERLRARHRPRHGRDPRDLLLLGRSAQIRRLRERHARAGLGGLSARDAGRPVHQPRRSRPAASASPTNGTRSPRPMPRPTRCSATS